ncbi:MAG: RepB family DNA primase [Acidobacteriia bacterium]|nr:RepB family DNA primase [Terriglobia bacterium]
MTGESLKTAPTATSDMLGVFASVGAETFYLTLTNRKGDKVGFRKSVPLLKVRQDMPRLLDERAHKQQNVIVRPCSPRAVFIQLDDLDAQVMERLKPAAFLCLQTSSGNYQAWIAMADNPDADFPRRLRKGAGADPAASGATRVAGSLNFKEQYAPAFPRVEITHTAPGRVATKEQLEALGLVATPEVAPPALLRVSPIRSAGRKWPSYQRCLEGAPPNHGNTGPDTSRADFTWCMTALTWGWSIEETADKLMELSGKARENGEIYAHRTAQNAASAVERRRTAHR